MDVTRSEEEQVEALKKWWSENGLAVIGGIIIGLIAIFGWRGWQGYQLAQAEAASNLYTHLILDVRRQKFVHARKVADQIIADYQRTEYAVYASLLLAKFDIDNGKPEDAVKKLQWVIDNTKYDELKHLSRIRIARILLSESKSEQALQLINSVSHGEYSASYEELRGDIMLQQGDINAARKAYQLALSESDDAIKDNSYLHMKIDNLGSEN